ncbi:hypothetical protein TNCV_4958621 [Trichonephila clavipes]|nr:hypothetical protein TNCV_4958621 [Trichonephila clavipes]
MRVAASRFVERNSRKDLQIQPPRRPPTGGRDQLAVPFFHRPSFFTADIVDRPRFTSPRFLTDNSSFFPTAIFLFS